MIECSTTVIKYRAWLRALIENWNIKEHYLCLFTKFLLASNRNTHILCCRSVVWPMGCWCSPATAQTQGSHHATNIARTAGRDQSLLTRIVGPSDNDLIIELKGQAGGCVPKLRAKPNAVRRGGWLLVDVWERAQSKKRLTARFARFAIAHAKKQLLRERIHEYFTTACALPPERQIAFQKKQVLTGGLNLERPLHCQRAARDYWALATREGER